MGKLTDTDKQTLHELQPVIDVLRVLVTSLAPLNPGAMPQVARLLRDRSTGPGVSTVGGVILFDLADGIDIVTGVDSST